jgi:hypothetical protein
VINTQPFPGPTLGSNFNYSVIQQGLTVNVSCEYQQLDVDTYPPLERFADPVEIAVGDELRAYTVVGIATTCPDGQRVQSGESSIYVSVGLPFLKTRSPRSSRCVDQHQQHTAIDQLSRN